jgi:hypothetical protein
VTTCKDHYAQVWDATTGRPVTPPLRHPAPFTVPGAAFRPDGTRAWHGKPPVTPSTRPPWDEPHRLRREIACALAQTLRCATRQHWALQLSMLEEPMERWERRQHGQATEEACERKWQALVKPYLRAYEHEMTEILGRWGLLDVAAHFGSASGGHTRASDEG